MTEVLSEPELEALEECCNLIHEVLDDDLEHLLLLFGQHPYFQEAFGHATRTKSKLEQVAKALHRII